LELPDDSPALELPWIITFGPLSDDEEWEPVVCGPYERAHALALAEAVVADEELMAVVEPLLPHVSAEEIQGEIAAARLLADAEAQSPNGAAADEVDIELEDDEEYGDEDDDQLEPATPPSVEEVRAGFARIAAKLAGSG
jgi:hypothetical protein